MPRPRFSKLPSDRQLRILECAAEEFGAHGYARASLNHIIAALGLNKGSFYYYFDGKADLFEAVVQMIWDLAAPPEFDPGTLDPETFWPSIEAVFLEGQTRLGEKPWLAGVTRLLLAPPGDATEAPPVTAILARGQAWATALLLHGQRIGAVRSDVPLDYLLSVLTAADNASDRWLLARVESFTPDSYRAASRRTLDLWRRIAEPRPLAGEREP